MQGEPRSNRPDLAYGQMRDKLTPDDVQGQAAALRVLSAERRDFAPSDARKSEYKIVLVFQEFPDKEYVVNATSYKTLVSKLGNDETRWPNQYVVMAPTTTTFDNRAYEKLHVASPDRWDKVMKSLKDAATASRGRR